MSYKGWITLAAAVLLVGGAVAGTAAVAADLQQESSPSRVLPGGTVTVQKAPVLDSPSSEVVDPAMVAPAAPPAEGTGVAVAPVPPAVAPPTDDDLSDDDDDSDVDESDSDDSDDD